MTDQEMVDRGRRNKSRGKSIERKHAAAFGVTRITDSRGIRQPDLFVELKAIDRRLAVEVKSRISANVAKLMDDAVGKAAPGDIPALSLELRRPGHNRQLIVMEQEDFIELIIALRG